MTSPPRRIQPLSAQLANQIAAGEVVERPASVLKELLENAIDAGATRLTVEAEGGGVRRLLVRDDGAGIHPDDLPLALTRHATSKIATQEELEAVASLGFRGEALASIASVARVRLTSRTPDAESGWLLAVDGGEATPEPVPAAHPVGTSVEVRELFFNIPARRRFLRAERTELAQLDDVVRRVALARPEVGLHFTHNGRVRMQLAPTVNGAERLAAVLGRGHVREVRPIAFDMPLADAGEETSARLNVTGWVSPAVGDGFAFINGRTVRDRLVQAALRRAGEQSGQEGPLGAVLHLTLPPTWVDVNVHPAKAEVRFRAARDVHDGLVTALMRALEASPTTDLWSETDCGGAGWLGVAEAPAVSEGGTGTKRSMLGNGTDEEGVLACWPDGYALLAGEPPQLLDTALARAELYRRRLRAGLEGDGVPARRLLVPVVLAEPAAGAIWRDYGVALARLGLELEPQDETGARLLRLPDIVADAEPLAWVAALIQAILAEPPPRDTDLVDYMVSSAAAHPAAPPTPAAIGALVHDLNQSGGLPTAVQRSLDGDFIKSLFRDLPSSGLRAER